MRLQRLACVLALGLLAPACGNNEDNNPLPRPTVSCGEGTVLQSGKCVLAETPLTCGDGTVERDGACVPTEALDTCGDGTTFNTERGLCLADVVCGPGTTAMSGRCLPDEEMVTLPGDPEAAGENDPAFGGTPQAVTLAAVGDSVQIRGTLDVPTDKNGDEQVDQDVDVYRFSGTAGMMIDVKVMQTGLGAFGLEIHGPGGFRRQAPRYAASPQRMVYLPVDGEYEIVVTSQARLFDPAAGAIGGADYGYLLVIEDKGPLDVATAEVLDLAGSAELKGQLERLDGALVKVQATSGALVRLAIEGLGEGASPIFTFVDAQGLPLGTAATGVTQTLVQAADAGVWVWLDYARLERQSSYTLRGTTLNAEDLGQSLKAGGQAVKSTSVQLGPTRDLYIAIDVEHVDAGGAATPQGVVVEFEAELLQSDLATSAQVFGPNNALLAAEGGRTVRFYADAPGRYIVRLINRDENLPQTITELAARSAIPFDLGTVGAGGAQDASFTVPGDAPVYFTFATASALGVDLELASSSGEPLSMTFFDRDTFSLQDATQGDAPLTLTRQLVARAGRAVGIISTLSDQSAQVTIKATGTGAPTLEVEPNDRFVTAQQLPAAEGFFAGELPPGDVDTFTFTPAQTTLLQIRSRTFGSQGAIQTTLMTGDQQVVDQSAPSFGTTAGGAVVEAGRTYTLTLTSPEANGTVGYSLSFEPIAGAPVEAEPNPDTASASTLSAAGAGEYEAVGTVTGFGDEDWFTITSPQTRYVSIGLETPEGFAQVSPSLIVEAFAADGITEIPIGSLAQLPAGAAYIRVRVGNNTGRGNTYRLVVRDAQFQDLGTVAAGSPQAASGTFGPDGLASFSFTLGASLPGDMSQTLLVASSAELQVYDAAGAPVHISEDSGQFFGSAADPSYASASAQAGTYFVSLRGTPGTAWSLLSAQVPSTREAAGDNDSLGTAQSLGALTVGGAPIYVFGSVDQTDSYDTFTVDLAGPATIQVEMFQLGTRVADLDVALLDDIGIGTQYATETPHIISEQRSAGTHGVQVTFADDVGVTSKEYVLRIVAQ